MTRLARVVLPNIPHHVTQRGNGRARTFFDDADYRFYRDQLTDRCREAGVGIWGWCLMPNHVHLVLTPTDEDGLRRALAQVHRRHAGRIHAREERTGHFWQGRFGCVAMDDDHLVAAMAYVALNPVRARLVKRADDWPWSSVHAWRDPAKGDGVTDTRAVKAFLPSVMALIDAGREDARFDALRKSETVGRPLGGAAFLNTAERLTGRALKPAKRGRKAKAKTEREEGGGLLL